MRRQMDTFDSSLAKIRLFWAIGLLILLNIFTAYSLEHKDNMNRYKSRTLHIYDGMELIDGERHGEVFYFDSDTDTSPDPSPPAVRYMPWSDDGDNRLIVNLNSTEGTPIQDVKVRLRYYGLTAHGATMRTEVTGKDGICAFEDYKVKGLIPLGLWIGGESLNASDVHFVIRFFSSNSPGLGQMIRVGKVEGRVSPGKYYITVNPERLGIETQSPTAKKGDAKILALGDGVKMELVYIPAGTFQMGSRLSPSEIVSRYRGKEEYFTRERPVHTVEVDGFYMGKFEVTNAQYRRYKSSHTSKDHLRHSLDDDSQPVVFVSWNDAKGFCEWLSQRTGEAVRLPYEAEWEYAARAGTETVRFWGDDDSSMGKYANTADRTAKSEWNELTTADTDDRYIVTAPVGSFRANAFGLSDMIGNVYEWCEDWYDEDYYSNSPRKNPTGASNGVDRVLRGGTCLGNPYLCRSAHRNGIYPVISIASIGFRVVVSVSSRKSQ